MADPIAEAEVDWSRFNKAIETLHREDKRTVPQLLRDQGRLLGVDLAYNTHPIGKGVEAKRQGEMAVTRDIMRAYITEKEVFEVVKNHTEIGPAKAFYKMMKAGNYNGASEILDRLGIKIQADSVGPWDGGETHRKLRNAKGAVPKRKSKFGRMIPNTQEMAPYIREIKKRVGYSKAGYAAGAAQLGTLRSFPGWVKRHAHGSKGGAEDKSRDSKDPYVSVYNGVPWIKNVTFPEGIARAMNYRIGKIESQASMMMHANLKKAGL